MQDVYVSQMSARMYGACMHDASVWLSSAVLTAALRFYLYTWYERLTLA